MLVPARWCLFFLRDVKFSRVVITDHASSKVRFRSTEGQTFYWSIMTADDSIKCGCANSGMKGQVGGFKNPGVCVQAFPSFLPHTLPALSLAPFVARSLTLVPRSLLLNRTETLATQATSPLYGVGEHNIRIVAFFL